MNAAYKYMDETFIDPELICNICQEPFNDPCCAPCGEIYCRECISRWIQTQKGSCPHCRRTMSIKRLNKVPRSLQNMLDRLRVKCTACGQADLKRGDLNDHFHGVCPKTVVSCPSANSKCSWKGQRNQIHLHLMDCRFLPMKPIITQLIAENQQLKDKVNQLIMLATEQQNENQQLREQIAWLGTQVNAFQPSDQQLKQQRSKKDTSVEPVESRNLWTRARIRARRIKRFWTRTRPDPDSDGPD